jgi:hypothetical protein
MRAQGIRDLGIRIAERRGGCGRVKGGRGRAGRWRMMMRRRRGDSVGGGEEEVEEKEGEEERDGQKEEEREMGGL